MKVLWITNIVFPEAQTLLNGIGALKASGGWMLGSADALVAETDVKLIVASVSKDVKRLTRLEGERITYYLLPYGKGNIKYNSDYEHLWIEVRDAVQPDVVHIHGTEYTHGIAYVNACGSKNVVVSIQGLVSAYYYYYYYGFTAFDVMRNLTLRDLIRGTIFQRKKSFKKRGVLEIELLQKINHVIGRTSWDKSRVWSINPMAHYHFCNETLRPEFYDDTCWEYEKCLKHSIFISQAEYPVKGLHQLLKAMPLILRHYPDTILRIAGKDITKERRFFITFHVITGYGLIIKRMIKSLGLEKHIYFTGSLNAEEMKSEYLHCNVFVCPSTIENSPNSLGEAQILGTPVIASYVGGVPDMMRGDEEHIYRFEEVEMLASAICDVFKNGDNQVDMRDIARIRHDRITNLNTMLGIYKTISNNI